MKFGMICRLSPFFVIWAVFGRKDIFQNGTVSTFVELIDKSVGLIRNCDKALIQLLFNNITNIHVIDNVYEIVIMGLSSWVFERNICCASSVIIVKSNILQHNWLNLFLLLGKFLLP